MSTTDIRAAFEAWHEKRFGWKPNHRVSGSGNYHDGSAQGRWMTWQAALEIDPSTGVSAKMPPDASDNDLLRIIKEGPEWKHFGMSNEESALLGIRACRAATEAAKATGTAGEPNWPELPSLIFGMVDDAVIQLPKAHAVKLLRAYGQQCAEAARQPAPVAIKTYQERMVGKICPGGELISMLSEIADLRAALAATAAPVLSDEVLKEQASVALIQRKKIQALQKEVAELRAIIEDQSRRSQP